MDANGKDDKDKKDEKDDEVHDPDELILALLHIPALPTANADAPTTPRSDSSSMALTNTTPPRSLPPPLPLLHPPLHTTTPPRSLRPPLPLLLQPPLSSIIIAVPPPPILEHPSCFVTALVDARSRFSRFEDQLKYLRGWFLFFFLFLFLECRECREYRECSVFLSSQISALTCTANRDCNMYRYRRHHPAPTKSAKSTNTSIDSNENSSRNCKDVNSIVHSRNHHLLAP